MSSVNKAIIVGNVGGDPEIRNMQNGGKVASFSIATSDGWKDKQTGERKEKTQWHKIVVFNDNLVGVIEKYVKKGSKIYIEGSIETRKYTDKRDNVEKYTTEIVLKAFNGTLVLLDSANRASQQADPADDYGTVQGETKQSSNYPSDMADEIPF